MKISDISKIDIKDIDINKIKDQLLGRKELVLQVGLGGVTFFLIMMIVGGGQKESKTYKSQIDTINSKSKVIGEYNAASQESGAFLEHLPASLSEDKIINLVTDLADKNTVKILTFSPNAENNESKGWILKTSIQFSMQAKSFKDMVRFISDIESNKSILQVKSFLVQDVNSMDSKSKQDMLLKFQVEVVSMEIRK